MSLLKLIVSCCVQTMSCIILITIYCAIIAAATAIIASELIFIVICCVQTMSVRGNMGNGI